MKNLLAGALIAVMSLPLAAAAGEFKDTCAYGLAEFGMLVETDCSINWKDPDSGKTYCFSSEVSKQNFLMAPEEYLVKAAENYSKLGRQ